MRLINTDNDKVVSMNKNNEQKIKHLLQTRSIQYTVIFNNIIVFETVINDLLVSTL